MPEPQEPESFEVDLFTVLTALGSGLHADLTPISEGGQYALANAPAYAHPRFVWFIDELPLASTNKVDRALLHALAQERLAGGESSRNHSTSVAGMGARRAP